MSEEPTVPNPASTTEIKWMGLCLLILAVLLFYVLIASWPVVQMDATAKAVKFKPFRLFNCYADWEVDKRMLFTVVIAGAIGSLVHALTSFADFVGNRRFSANWIWWYGLRLPIGSAIALLFYFIVRGGLLVPTVQNSQGIDVQASTLALNPYAIAAFAALAGMFAKNASDKFSEVFEALMSRKDPVNRADALRGGGGLKIEPEKLTKGKPEILTVTGRGFSKEAIATINGKSRVLAWTSETQVKVTTVAEDVAQTGKLELVVKNPNAEGLKTSIDVVDSTKPVVSSVDPPSLTNGTTPASPLVVKGSGFQEKCTATINGTPHDVTPGSSTEIKVTILAADVKDAGKLKLVVKNPDGQSSDPFEIEVK